MNIGRLAPFYRWIEYAAFGRALERRRFAFLTRLAQARRILILGEGDGRALAQLLLVAPQAHIDIVESSAEMIALAQARVGTSDRVRFLCGDARDFPVSHDYDGIVTFFVLDCFEDHEVRSLVGRLKQSLASGGIWLVSDFAIPESGWRRWHAAAWVGTMYRFFRISTGLRTNRLPRIENILAEAGLTRIGYETERAGMMFSSAWTEAKNHPRTFDSRTSGSPERN